ncbi:MAG TPA: acyl-CoA dehydrogenase family protein [Planctomycetota bacterium]|nr:acyl-CoA dehydrogenase family protein [Planctomycetota bacterium]
MAGPQTRDRATDAVDLALAAGEDASGGQRRALLLAEEARDEFSADDSFAGSLFLGRAPWGLVHPFPAPPAADLARGDAFLAKLAKVLRESVDAEKIDRTGEIPDAAIEALRGIGAFGIKIPQEHGGLGLRQWDYTRAAMLLGSHCASTTALLSAHQSIGLPQPLLLFGNEEQKKRWLPRLARGELSAFALTEEGAGSDPARMETRAVPATDGGWVLDGAKLWCTNGTRASLLVVVAKTPPVDGRDRFTAFVVDAKAPGVKVEHRCEFLGMRGIYNAALSFKGVRVPATDVLGAEGRGMRVALTTLNTGRLTLPAAAVGTARRCLAIQREWGAAREQWGRPVGRHAAVAEMIGKTASDLFAMESMTMLTSALVDGHRADVRLEAGMAKLWCTERLWEIVNDTLQVRGGRGYETPASLRARGEKDWPVERMLRDARINTVFEGSSEILRLFLAREALDPHLKIAGDALNPKIPAGRRLAAKLRAGLHYALWLPAKYLPFDGAPAGLHPRLAARARRVGAGSRVLARRLLYAMARRGPALEREQVLLGRFVDAGTELFAQAASVVRAQRLLDEGRPADEVLPVAELLCDRSAIRGARALGGVRRNADAATGALAGRVLDGNLRWLEDGTTEAPPR